MGEAPQPQNLCEDRAWHTLGIPAPRKKAGEFNGQPSLLGHPQVREREKERCPLASPCLCAQGHPYEHAHTKT